MAKFKVDVNASHENADHASTALSGDAQGASSNGSEDLLRKAATVGVIGVGVALFEAALIPGMIIGVAAALAPKYLPNIGNRVQPLVRSTVRGAYKIGMKARSAVAEAQEQMHDIVAEVRAEDTGVASTTASTAPQA